MDRNSIYQIDGLKGFPEAMEAVLPETEVQLCIVHLIRRLLPHMSLRHDMEEKL